MPRVTCARCGAPTVLGASRCPKCLAPFGGESPTSGVVLVEPPPRAGGASDARRWRSLVLGVLGLVGIAALFWSIRDRAAVERPGPSAPAEPEPGVVDAAPAPTEASGSPSEAAPESAAATGAAPAVLSDAPPEPMPGLTAAETSREARPAPPAEAGEAGLTFAYETLTWVRVRTAPSVEASVVATLAPGTRVEVSAIGRGWLTIRWEGQVGWVGASLLTRVR